MRADDAGGRGVDAVVTFTEGLKYPLSVADYMAACNAHYYNTRDPLGAAGDFITAPEISQIFGEVIAAFIAHVAGTRTDIHLIEGGPGRGTLMADMLRVLTPDHVTLIETSEVLRHRQAELLITHKERLEWVNFISDIKLKTNTNTFIFNEFFDALPTEQYVFINGSWCERLVDNSVYHVGTKTDLACPYTPREGDVVEYSPARLAAMRDVCGHVQVGGGMAIIIDYGTDHWGLGDTLQAVKNHQPVDPLSDAGNVDLTTHVDFGALASVARDAGLYVHPLMTQGAFLNHLGGFIRAAKLGKEIDYARLTAPDQMGELFKVLIVAHPDWAETIKGVLP